MLKWYTTSLCASGWKTKVVGHYQMGGAYILVFDQSGANFVLTYNLVQRAWFRNNKLVFTFFGLISTPSKLYYYRVTSKSAEMRIELGRSAWNAEMLPTRPHRRSHKFSYFYNISYYIERKAFCHFASRYVDDIIELVGKTNEFALLILSEIKTCWNKKPS